MKIVEQYKQYFEEYSKKYEKERLAIMMQVGDFYEFYGVETESLCFGNVTQIASLLDIVRSRKNKDSPHIDINSPLFTGFPKHSAQKHIKKLLDNNYYVVQIDQQKDNPTQRSVSKVLSKGTYIDDLSNNTSTTIACIYYGDCGGVGVSFLDLSIGVCKSFEIENNACEITRIIEAECPCETLTFSSDGSIGEKANRFHTQPHHQESILQYYYPSRGFLSAIEFIDMDMKHNARTSLVCLLQYAKEQNADITQKLNKPIVQQDTNFLKLEDTALYQLGIVSQFQKTTLFHTINKTCTQQGMRLLKKNLLSPLVSLDELNERYDMVDQFQKCHIVNELKSLVDIEKYVHRWRLGKMSPHEFVILVYCFPTLQAIIKNVHTHTSLRFEDLDMFIDFDKTIQTTFFYEMLEKYYSLHNIEGNVFRKGIKPELDALQEKLDEINTSVQSMVDVLMKNDKSEKKQAVIRFEKTANNDSWYFSTTSKRIESLKKANALHGYETKTQKSNVRLFHKDIDAFRMQYIDTLAQMIECVQKEFVNQLDSFEVQYGDMMKKLVTFIGSVDFYNNGALLIQKYGYTRPTLVESSESFINAKNMRHPIIERLDLQTDYVPNDVMLPSDEKSGMLLFGLNGGGKSSYMKAVGLNVVLAQIGYWVPCESFSYSPFRKLFTRISGDDNITKGLSSFGVEMKELRNILQKSDVHSLVLGDEICKGTEQDSAHGIVAASLVTLSRRNKSRFIFATHLHALSSDETIKSLVHIYHLSVEMKNDTIVYHRKLLPGSGPSLYGLMVAKHLLHDDEVIQLANDMRPKHEDPMKESKYNSKVLMKECEICQCKTNLDVHHIEFQCTANEHNLVTHGKHKNAQSNLVVLCKKHHEHVHQDKIQIHGWKETSQGIQLDWENVTPQPKAKKCKYNTSQLEIIKGFQSSALPKKVVVMKLKDEHGIQISVGTLGKYWS